MRVHWAHDQDGGVSIAEVGFGHNDADDAVRDQFLVLIEALEVYAERNLKYKDNWRRMGWRGMLIRVRERAERLWDDLWDAEPMLESEAAPPYQPHDVDDAIDLINLAAFLIRGVREGDRDGSWWT